MASAAQRVAKLASEGVTGLLSTTGLQSELLERHGIEATLQELRLLHGQGIGYDSTTPFVFPPVKEFLAGLDDTPERRAEVLQRREYNALGWVRVKRQGWAQVDCRTCRASGPVRSAALAHFGDHVKARVEGTRVVVRCCCTRLLASLRPLLVPHSDYVLLGGKVAEGGA